MNKQIYDHSNAARKNLCPGGPDTYRENRYVRDDEEDSFRVVTAASSLSPGKMEEKKEERGRVGVEEDALVASIPKTTPY